MLINVFFVVSLKDVLTATKQIHVASTAVTYAGTEVFVCGSYSGAVEFKDVFKQQPKNNHTIPLPESIDTRLFIATFEVDSGLLKKVVLDGSSGYTTFITCSELVRFQHKLHVIGNFVGSKFMVGDKTIKGTSHYNSTFLLVLSLSLSSSSFSSSASVISLTSM